LNNSPVRSFPQGTSYHLFSEQISLIAIYWVWPYILSFKNSVKTTTRSGTFLYCSLIPLPLKLHHLLLTLVFLKKENDNSMRRIFNLQKGITGLETAIILIAFVVVAAVLAYTVMSAGLFSTDKSREAVYSGLQKVQGAIGVRGAINGYRDTLNAGNTGSVGRVNITIAQCSNGGQADLTPAYSLDPDTGALVNSNPGANRLQIGFIDKDMTLQDCAWTVAWIGNHNGDKILDYGEKAVITVWLHDFDGSVWGPPNSESSTFLGEHYIDTAHTFTLELKSASGAVLSIQRTTPDYLFNVVSLD
jgi:flagellin FlaB